MEKKMMDKITEKIKKVEVPGLTNFQRLYLAQIEIRKDVNTEDTEE